MDAETTAAALLNKGNPLSGLLPQPPPSSSSASSSKPGSVTGVVTGGAGGAGATGAGSAGGAGTKPGSAGGDASRRCVSVNDIRRAFEKAEASLSNSLKAASTW